MVAVRMADSCCLIRGSVGATPTASPLRRQSRYPSRQSQGGQVPAAFNVIDHGVQTCCGCRVSSARRDAAPGKEAPMHHARFDLPLFRCCRVCHPAR